MLFANIISELEKAELTQKQIADAADSNQANISAIKKRGSIPNWFIGHALIELHKVHCPKSKLLVGAF